MASEAAGGAGGERVFAAIAPSKAAARTVNPIRNIVDKIVFPEGKDIISLSLGDPCVFGNLKAPKFMIDRVVEAVSSYEWNGYAHSAGIAPAREAVATKYSLPGLPALTPDDVIITSGCSGALDAAITVLCNEGDSLLIPRPAFSLYETIATSRGINAQHYKLDSTRSWEADLADMEAAIDGTTRAILVNNPSNPCGSVYSRAHLTEIIKVAAKHKLPIIADEIYGDLVFSGHEYVPMASIAAEHKVPVLTVGGLAKEWLVPGWRIGWVVVYDTSEAVFAGVRAGLVALSQLVLGASVPMQHAIMAVLTPKEEHKEELAAFNKRTLDELEANAKFVVERLGGGRIKGLTVVVPQGAMYVMVGIVEGAFKGVSDDSEFCQRLLDEEGVFVLPGQCFGLAHFVRFVLCPPIDKLTQACDRIAAFCERNYVGSGSA